MWCTMNVSGAVVVAVVVADIIIVVLTSKRGFPLPCALALLTTRRIHDVCHLGRPYWLGESEKGLRVMRRRSRPR
jgi:hypothetical protein